VLVVLHSSGKSRDKTASRNSYTLDTVTSRVIAGLGLSEDWLDLSEASLEISQASLHKSEVSLS
jgi:hypothetical protein